MKHKKSIIFLLAMLLIVKFIYLPWNEWAEEKQVAINQLSLFHEKQKKAIENQDALILAYEKNQKALGKFVGGLSDLDSSEKANSMWFRLFESIKSDELKIYNQKIEFEGDVTEKFGYVVGSLSLSGRASTVVNALVTLEKNAPYVFFDSLILSRPGGANRDNLIAQLHVGYWFKRNEEK